MLEHRHGEVDAAARLHGLGHAHVVRLDEVQQHLVDVAHAQRRLNIRVHAAHDGYQVHALRRLDLNAGVGAHLEPGPLLRNGNLVLLCAQAHADDVLSPSDESLRPDGSVERTRAFHLLQTFGNVLQNGHCGVALLVVRLELARSRRQAESVRLQVVQHERQLLGDLVRDRGVRNCDLHCNLKVLAR
jgi:hypothetical protein